ncbi:MAG TPA: prephenate dehydratase domain-containing protein [Acidimicrobiia bacterium]|jgi:prephenate dehydratase|nr:prephenate dehydratase domain-containing protein [Acidimicrobiia bacterium]
MRVGYQGEAYSYSDRACRELFPADEHVGFHSFVAAFEGLARGEVERLVVPIENSTTGSVLPVLDRLLPGDNRIVGEHLVEVRHALLGLPGTAPEQIERVLSHPEALGQAEAIITHWGWEPVPVADTAGAVRQVAEARRPSDAALAPEAAAAPHQLAVLLKDVIDRDHNTTRFVVLAQGEQPIPEDADKTTIAFTTRHTPGALALALAELGLRGANLSRIESRPSDEAWSYRFFADVHHSAGPEGVAAIFDPPLATLSDLRFLGTYRSAGRS